MALAGRPMISDENISGAGARAGQSWSRGTGTDGTLPKGMCPVLSPCPVSMDAGDTKGHCPDLSPPPPLSRWSG